VLLTAALERLILRDELPVWLNALDGTGIVCAVHRLVLIRQRAGAAC
jgi:hypothetical protein